MKIYDRLMTSIRHNGRKIKLSLYYNRVLDALDMIDDERFDPDQKVDYCLSRLCKGKHPNDGELLAAIFEAILPERKGKRSEKLIDYTQDAELIIAAFQQAYGINLIDQQDKLHWTTFLALMRGLPKSTRLAEVVQIRARPMPKPTKYNAEERMELARLKAEFALELSEKEKEANLQDGLRQIATLLMAKAQKG